MDKLKGANISRNWMSDGVTITSVSGKGTNGKLPSKLIEDFSNRWSFFLECATHHQHSKQMDAIFVDMIEGCIVIIYMDDILIFARTQEDLEKYTKLVLQRLRENDLFLKAMKCEFNKTRVEYLGMIVEEGKIAMDPIKLG